MKPRRLIIPKVLLLVIASIFLSAETCQQQMWAYLKTQASSNETIAFCIGCAPAGKNINDKKCCNVNKENNPGIICTTFNEFINIPITQTYIADCKAAGKVYAIWPEIFKGSTQGIRKESIETWYTLARDILNYLKTSGADNKVIEQSAKNIQTAYGWWSTELKDITNKIDLAVNNALTDFTTRIKNKFSASTDQTRLDITEAKTNVKKITPIINAYRIMANPFTDKYLDVVKAYAPYKATETTLANFFLQKTQAASNTSDYGQLYQIRNDLINNYQIENSAPTAMISSISSLRTKMNDIQTAYMNMMNPYLNFMKASQLKVPDVLSVPINSLDAMAAYCASRKDYLEKSTRKLIDGIDQRIQGIIMANADAATKTKLTQSMQLKRATDFINTMNAILKDLWALPPTSTNLKLSYYKPQYDKFVSFLQYETPCTAALKASSSWMKQGCTLMQGEFTKAKNYLQYGLPAVVQMNLSILQTSGADSTLLAKANQFVAQGNWAEATRLQDAAIDSTEVPQ